MKHTLRACAACIAAAFALVFVGCGSGGGGGPKPTIIVNSLDDEVSPSPPEVTLRSALAASTSADIIGFDRSLDGATITLSIVADEHTVLKGEVYTGGTYSGYQDRDYGKSALYATHSVTIDASNLRNGITLKWGPGSANPARVLAVLGDLTMRGVTVLGGRSVAAAIGTAQAYTLARGGGLAVWGTATLDDCVIAGNAISGDTAASRDRGAYGGGLYANGLRLTNCVVSGNTADGVGAAGGGIYSVGGADNAGGAGNDTRIENCSVTGNRVTAQHAYGGGIFTLSGGPSNLATMTVVNSTIARNVVEDHPSIPQMGQYYYRGGGVYMGGGSLELQGCTIAENSVSGTPATFSNKPNMGGGGVCATVGNAHTVEMVWLQQTVIVGNTLNGAPEDWYAGSLLAAFSRGYNIVGVPDFSQILVPVPEWMDLSRVHFPKVGDQLGVTLGDALDLGGVVTHATAVSAGTDQDQPAVVSYPPGVSATNKVPQNQYSYTYVDVGYVGAGAASDDFINQALAQMRTVYASTLGSSFGSGFGNMQGVTFHGPAITWVTEPSNAAWIKFWRDVNVEIAGRLGPVGLNDTFWATFTTGQLGMNDLTVTTTTAAARPLPGDQNGRGRPSGGAGDIGAIER